MTCPNCGTTEPRVAQERLERVRGRMKMKMVLRMSCPECGYHDKREKVPDAALRKLIEKWPPKKQSPAMGTPGREGEAEGKRQPPESTPPPAPWKGFAVIRGGRS